MRMIPLQPNYATSADGTRIGFLSQGSGPGIALIQGAMADVHAYSALATSLAPVFTVHRIERRGRGLSPRPYSPTHDIARDVEDIAAVLAATGARRIFGLSSGAVIALETARSLGPDLLDAVAVFEPPFYADGIDRAGLERLLTDLEGDQPDLAAALLDALMTAHRPGPDPCVAAAYRVSTTLRDLLPGVRYDFHDVASVDGRMESFSVVRVPALVLSGTASPAFLREAARTLQGVLPNARHVELEGLGHDGPWNGGAPEKVAVELRAFF
ncbi:hypothetical protein HK405_002595 [Cladochytrium tenue]|nr:hypothetical protein HK405_002595 [Cladochytrium tenue]